MNTLIEKQVDGYMVKEENGRIEITGPSGKKMVCHASHFHTWDKLEENTRSMWAKKVPDEMKTGLFASPYPEVLYRIRPIGDAVTHVMEIADKINKDHERLVAERVAARNAVEAPLLAIVKEREIELVKQMPADAIRCDVKIKSDGDGGSYPIFSIKNVEIKSPKIVGWASAPRTSIEVDPVCVAYITHAEFDAIQEGIALEAKKDMDAKQADKDRLTAIFTKAMETGQRQVLKSWVTDRCMNRHDDDCSFDNAYQWAMPDGTTRITYTCCY